MAEESEILIGVDLPLGEVAAELARVLGAVVEPDTGEYLVRVGGSLLGSLAEEGPGEFAFDVTETAAGDDAQSRAAVVYDTLTASTPWALTMGRDDAGPIRTRPALTRT